MKKTLNITMLFVLIIPFLLLIQPTNSYACSCMMPPLPDQALAETDAVFAGKVVNIQQSSNTFQVTFDVSESWKNVNQTQVAVKTSLDEASCGFTFDIDQEYLVYAYNYNGALETSLCSRTNLLSNAGDDLQVLGTGEAPTEEVNLSEETKEVNWTLISMFGILGIVVVGGVWMLVRSSKKD